VSRFTDYYGGRRAADWSVSKIDRISDGSVIHAQVVGDPADHDDSGVERDSHLHDQPAVLLKILPMIRARAGWQAQHARRAAARLVRNRRSEQRHEAVAAVLVDGAFEAVNFAAISSKQR